MFVISHTVIVFFGPFWRPLCLSALGRRLIRLMVAPALHTILKQLQMCNYLKSFKHGNG